ncbi:TIGR01457 family HAD-type hydrolase [Aliibacillus thermotolerans]|uniref:TIGR01457 family HAD-type hydrolase n=1 Tax=Aliibacillus thermotolerans TaxID=1834418 RepID=A0ABW0U778_9BACI|nr:TIGR01457 family HAD-type hydrolase [Aliibacillus thermotolerans]MDA3129680.1 TIGR01457 family HAD-type hydrolase [Aliibacillus thermotolerans]
MKNYEAYLFDLDGTIYRGNEPLLAAIDFVHTLYQKDIPYMFVSNNSTATPATVAKRLQNMGIKATPSQVITSGEAAVHFISQQDKEKSVYVIGESGLKTLLSEAGMKVKEDHPAYVVVGLDRKITYEKFTKACIAVRNGATFISTNNDSAIPTEDGLYPGNGALTSVITVATGQRPIFVGKPEKMMIEQAIERLGVKRETVVMVGDNYDTDIRAGINANIDTIHVQTGVTSKRALEKKDIPPTYSISSLSDWII